VVAGGVGANTRLRALLDRAAARDGFRVFYPAMEFCTDNGAMIALAGALRLRASPSAASDYRFAIFPRWDLATIAAPAR
jgi:N6-L-threonylcarbamoyladenine synthase